MNGFAVTDAEFLAKVQRGKGCWEWTGDRNAMGYGRIRRMIHGVRPSVTAHRLSYELFCGPIPTHTCVLHRCDNPSCVRPDHLFLGTYADNNADRDSKGRHRCPLGEQHGNAKLTTADVRAIRSAVGPQADIASAFHVGVPTVSNIRARKTWKHVP